MTKTQWYIGAPNGVVICADCRTAAGISGRLYHSYRTDEQTFGDFEQMVSLMEELFNALNFPHPGTNERNFTPVQKTGEHYTERQKVMKDESLLNKHGDLMQSRRVMVKLIENAVDSVCDDEDREETPQW